MKGREIIPLRGKRRGYNVERKLVRFLRKKEGNYVFRVPVSGSRPSPKSNVALPDIFLVNNIEDRVVAFEVKCTSNSKVKVSKNQIIKLFKFLDAFKKYRKREAVIAVWFFKDKKWVFKKVNEKIDINDVTVKNCETSNWFP